MSAKPLPPQAVLLAHFEYDPLTGSLSHLKKHNRAKPGEPAFACVDNAGRLVGGFRGVNFLAHRIIWKMMYGVDPDHIDHIDGNPKHNRLSNLRSVSHTENMRNRKGRADGSQVGVFKVASGWRALACIDGTTRNLGRFHSQAEAAAARKAVEVALGYHPNHGRPRAEVAS